MNKTILYVLGIIILVSFGYIVFKGLPQNTSPTSLTSGPPEIAASPDSKGFVGKKLAENYYEFDSRDWTRIQAEKIPVLLYFYANWCPTCVVQEQIMIPFMNSGRSEEKIAIRVNYNDSNTDQAEKELAKKYTVNYQHTFVPLNSTQVEQDKVNGMQTEDDLKKLFSQVTP